MPEEDFYDFLTGETRDALLLESKNVDRDWFDDWDSQLKMDTALRHYL